MIGSRDDRRKTDVPEDEELPVMTSELELAGMLLHQRLESPERHNLMQGRVHSVNPGFGTKQSPSLINEPCINPN
jgi:hypothetical protein